MSHRDSPIKKNKELKKPMDLFNTGFVGIVGGGAVASLINDTDLKALWNQDEASGNLLNTSQAAAAISNSDLVPAGTAGHGATGHIAGLDAYNYNGANGTLTQANGNINDYSFITKSGGVFTLMWWMKLNSAGSVYDICGTGGSTSNNIQIRHRGSVDQKFAFFFMNEGELLTTLTVANTSYHFYMVQYDDAVGDLKMSVDNGTVETVASGLNVTNTSDATDTWGFGDVGTAHEFTGDIQQFLMFNKIVSAGDITSVYNSGSGAIFYP